MRHPVLPVALAVFLAGCTAAGEPADRQAEEVTVYRVHYSLILEPEAGGASATLALKQDRHLLREARFGLSGSRWTDFEGDGSIERRGDTLVWQPPADGGALRWRVELDHRRGDAYDALLTPRWALFRGEDVFPAAATRTLTGAESEATFSVEAPSGWSVVTPYAEEDGRYRVVNPERRFDRPTGWMVAGELGVRRETIAGVQTAVAGPVGQGVRRMDILALLAWTLPELARLVPDLPPRLTIVSAGDPMWRGALSGPDSLYLHAERPLISENGTSTILHELMHVVLGRDAVEGDDWILEGFSEYYSVELLRRSGTVTAARNRDTLAGLEAWGEEADRLRKRHSTGATTALAVTVLGKLDAEIAERTEGERSLDDVLTRLARGEGDIDLDELVEVSAEVIGERPRTLTSAAFRRLLESGAR